MNEAYARRRALIAQAKTRRDNSKAHRRAHGPKIPNGAALGYLQAIRRVLKPFQAKILAALNTRVLEDYSSAHDVGLRRDESRPKRQVAGDAGRAIQELRVELQSSAGVAAVLPITDAAGRTIASFNAREMKRVIGIDPRHEPGVAGALDEFRARNVSLITNIPEELLDQVEGVLADNFGLRAEELAKLIQERLDVSDSRAALIARDQTLKLNGQLTQVRCANAGIEEYDWTTCGDEKVREEHEARDGKRYRFDNPPEDGNPGEPILCRCTPYPVIPELDEDAGESTDDPDAG